MGFEDTALNQRATTLKPSPSARSVVRVIACLLIVALAGCANPPVLDDVVEPEPIEPVLHQRAFSSDGPEIAWCPTPVWGCLSVNPSAEYIDIGHNETTQGLEVEVTAPDRLLAELELDIVCYGPCGHWTDQVIRGAPPLRYEWNGSATDGASFGAFVTWYRPEAHGTMLDETWRLTGHLDVLVYPSPEGGPNRPS